MRARSARWPVRVAQRDGATLGYVVVDDVIGKFELISYAVGIGRDGTIRQVEVLSYRESHGHEIRLPAWRKQFVGKTASAPLRVGEDIANISGATLSCTHVTEGVQAHRRGGRPGAPERGRWHERSTHAIAGGAARPAAARHAGRGGLCGARSGDDAALLAACDLAFDAIADVQRCLSRFDAGSDIARFNALRRRWLARRASGHRHRAVGRAATVQRQRRRVRRVARQRAARLALRGGRLHKLHDDARLDLGGIGKGHAVDRAVQALQSRGPGRRLGQRRRRPARFGGAAVDLKLRDEQRGGVRRFRAACATARSRPAASGLTRARR